MTLIALLTILALSYSADSQHCICDYCIQSFEFNSCAKKCRFTGNQTTLNPSAESEAAYDDCPSVEQCLKEINGPNFLSSEPAASWINQYPTTKGKYADPSLVFVNPEKVGRFLGRDQSLTSEPGRCEWIAVEKPCKNIQYDWKVDCDALRHKGNPYHGSGSFLLNESIHKNQPVVFPQDVQLENITWKSSNIKICFSCADSTEDLHYETVIYPEKLRFYRVERKDVRVVLKEDPGMNLEASFFIDDAIGTVTVSYTVSVEECRNPLGRETKVSAQCWLRIPAQDFQRLGFECRRPFQCMERKILLINQTTDYDQRESRGNFVSETLTLKSLTESLIGSGLIKSHAPEVNILSNLRQDLVECSVKWFHPLYDHENWKREMQAPYKKPSTKLTLYTARRNDSSDYSKIVVSHTIEGSREMEIIRPEDLTKHVRVTSQFMFSSFLSESEALDLVGGTIFFVSLGQNLIGVANLNAPYGKDGASPNMAKLRSRNRIHRMKYSMNVGPVEQIKFDPWSSHLYWTGAILESETGTRVSYVLQRLLVPLVDPPDNHYAPDNVENAITQECFLKVGGIPSPALDIFAENGSVVFVAREGIISLHRNNCSIIVPAKELRVKLERITALYVTRNSELFLTEQIAENNTQLYRYDMGRKRLEQIRWLKERRQGDWFREQYSVGPIFKSRKNISEYSIVGIWDEGDNIPPYVEIPTLRCLIPHVDLIRSPDDSAYSPVAKFKTELDWKSCRNSKPKLRYEILYRTVEPNGNNDSCQDVDSCERAVLSTENPDDSETWLITGIQQINVEFNRTDKPVIYYVEIRVQPIFLFWEKYFPPYLHKLPRIFGSNIEIDRHLKNSVEDRSKSQGRSRSLYYILMGMVGVIGFLVLFIIFGFIAFRRFKKSAPHLVPDEEYVISDKLLKVNFADRLGSGNSLDTYRAVWHPETEGVANVVAQFPKSNAPVGTSESLLRGAWYQIQLRNSDRIVKIHGVCMNYTRYDESLQEETSTWQNIAKQDSENKTQLAHQNEICMVAEEMTLSLGDYLRGKSKLKEVIPQSDLIVWAIEASEAVEAVHEKWMVHRDVAARNFLMKNGHLKLTDFLLAVSASNEGPYRSFMETHKPLPTNITPPEGFLNSSILGIGGDPIREVTPKSDVWSFGCFLFELFTGKLPFHQILGQYRKIKNHVCRHENLLIAPRELSGNERLEWSRELDDIPVKIRNIMRECFHHEPAMRPDMGKVIRMLKEAQEELWPVGRRGPQNSSNSESSRKSSENRAIIYSQSECAPFIVSESDGDNFSGSEESSIELDARNTYYFKV